MTNNHCPARIEWGISPEIDKAIADLAEMISEKIYENAEELSFDALSTMPEEWASCNNCEKVVLNAQEAALAEIERRFLAKIKTMTPIFD